MGLFRSLIVVLLVVLAGCARDRALDIQAVAAPRLVEYSPEQQAAVSTELEACGGRCEHTSQFITDYGNLRAAVRAAKE